VKTKRTVALVYGFWGQNIGNAFFNVGGRWILDQMFTEHQISEIQDQPGLRTFNRKMRGNPKNDFGLLSKLNVDYIVLQGPMLNAHFRVIWEDTFKALAARGTKFIYLSAALFHYTKEEIEGARAFLKEYPPTIISTRDSETFKHVRDLAPYTYEGIDSAFFAPKAYTPPPLAADPFITINFDQYPEPNIVCSDTPLSPEKFDRVITALGKHFGLKQPRLQMKFSAAGQWQCYLGALLDFRKLPAEICGFQVVRPEHRVNPDLTWKIYSQPNGLSSDEPYTYLTAYAKTKLTLSDRVHACVATLAYGNPAMLLHPTPRGYLFARVGLNEIRQKPMSLDPEYLETERKNQVAFLKNAVTQIESGA
jgi:hypothetical protein